MGIFRNYKPLTFFGGIGLLCLLVSVGLALPNLVTYQMDGVILGLGSLLGAVIMAIIGVQSCAIGLILNTIAYNRRLAQEMWMLDARIYSQDKPDRLNLGFDGPREG